MAVIGKQVRVGGDGSASSRVIRRSASASRKASSEPRRTFEEEERRNGFTSRDANHLADQARAAHKAQEAEQKGRLDEGHVPSNTFAGMREHLRQDIVDYGLVRVPTKSNELRSLEGNGYYSWQFYLRAPLLRAPHLGFIGRAFWSVYRQRFNGRPFQIAGVESASLPVITSLLLHAPMFGIDVSAFTIRKERKQYGLENLIEGRPNGLPVVLVDDLTSTEHNSLWHAVRALRDRGLELYPTAFVVLFKGRKQGSPRTIETSIGTTVIESIYCLDDFNLSFDQSFHKNAMAGAVA